MEIFAKKYALMDGMAPCVQRSVIVSMHLTAIPSQGNAVA